MIEKYLLRFCAQEVRTLIARLHERPEDFDYGSKWRDLIKEQRYYTWVERVVLRKEWAYHLKNEGRRQLLNAITKEVLDPTPVMNPKWFAHVGGGGGGGSVPVTIQNLQAQHTAHIRAHMHNQKTQAAMWADPQSIYQGTNHV